MLSGVMKLREPNNPNNSDGRLEKYIVGERKSVIYKGPWNKDLMEHWLMAMKKAGIPVKRIPF